MRATPLSYSLVVMHGDSLYAIRDPFGNRPLCIGRIVSRSDDDDSHSVERSPARRSNFEARVLQTECFEKFNAACDHHAAAFPAMFRSGSGSLATPADVQHVAKRLLQSLKFNDSTDCTSLRSCNILI